MRGSLVLNPGDLLTVHTNGGARPARYVQPIAGTPNHQVRLVHPGRDPEDLGFPVVVHAITMQKAAICRSCGCSDFFACEGGCSWVEPDLCSSCAT